jgi:hypothetical protein
MTPKQADRLRQQIAAIRRTLAAEKKKFGGYDDSRGLRYLPTRYYVQLADFAGGLTYLRWFTKNFPDDAGFPDFLFEWTLILFETGKLAQAEQQAFATYCADRQLFDHLLARPLTPPEPWEAALLPAASYAAYFTSLGPPPKLAAFAQWLATWLDTARFRSRAAQYGNLQQQVQTAPDRATRHALLDQLGHLRATTWQTAAPATPRCAAPTERERSGGGPR